MPSNVELKPYRGGRPHALADPDMAQQVAEAFVAGLTRKQMSELFDVDPKTITRWRRDPRIRPLAQKLIEDRVLSVTRKVDSEIEARLGSPEQLTVKELIEIRREFLGGQLRQKMESIDDETMGEAMQMLEQYPELAEQMVALMEGTATVVPKEHVVEGSAEDG
jgi:hypothetical protein